MFCVSRDSSYYQKEGRECEKENTLRLILHIFYDYGTCLCVDDHLTETSFWKRVISGRFRVTDMRNEVACSQASNEGSNPLAFGP